MHSGFIIDSLLNYPLIVCSVTPSLRKEGAVIMLFYIWIKNRCFWCRIFLNCPTTRLVTILSTSYVPGRDCCNLFSICLKWLVTQKLIFFCRVSSISTRLFFNVKCTFKRTSIRLFRFKISESVPFLIKNPQNLLKICKRGQIVKF